MYTIKQIPEDFVVIESSTLTPKETGGYALVKLKKKDFNTMDACQRIARALKMPSKVVSCAGNKDKRAITEQLCSIKANSEHIKRLELQDIQLEVLGRIDRPVSLGILEGNHFKIVVRNIETIPQKIDSFINYFGTQRFGQQNVPVGRAIVQKDFKKVCELLELEGTNYVQELQNHGVRKLLFYVHAYQSLIWNKTVEELVKKDITVDTVPLPGFGMEYTDDNVKEIMKGILKEEELKKRDFIIRQLPELSVEGTPRHMYVHAEGLQIGELEEDDLNEGMKKVTIEFFLKKGCYATEFIAELLKEQ